jgi:hydroxyacylglutathione hydrolase
MKRIFLVALVFCPLASATLLPEYPPHWHPGAEECAPDTTVTEIRTIDDRTYVLRQNPCVDFEANLVYLLLGTKRALLIDTGAVEGAAAEPLVEWVRQVLKGPGKGELSLLVVHTHGHQDHRAGDQAVLAIPNTEISTTLPSRIDLGNREVEVIAAPGHSPDHVVFYDAQSAALFTGDFLLIGRLLVQDLDAYHASAQRVAEFVKTHPVEYVLGAHIELDFNGNPYPSGATFHLDERTRPLKIYDVGSLPGALANFNGFYSRFPSFIVVNPIHNLLALVAGVILALALLTWMARRLWRRRRADMG